jgi:XRE family aerobic/anaerobic benzoate catabolism transcriptional regulator
MKAVSTLQNSRAQDREEVEFLAGVGRCVRELREQRGVTRRWLAQQADVSERYLGQLEAGDGNISIVLLRRVAVALGVQIAALLETEQDLSRDRIALIGLRGAGKSTLGAALAHKLGVKFVELDRVIEEEAGLPLAELFSLYGQAGYRRFERRSLERIFKDPARAVIAVGGGVVTEADTFDLLLANCYTIWLKARPEEHMQRVVAQGDLRPMSGSGEAMQDLKRILQARVPLYQKADATVDTTGLRVDAALAQLQDAVAR